MAVDKPLQSPLSDDEALMAAMELDVPIDNTEIDGMVVAIDGYDLPPELDDDFNSNIAEQLDDSDASEIGGQLLADYEADLNSREEWAKTLKQGMQELGLKIEERTEPWDGASGVFHPLLPEALVSFQSQIIQEVFPARGPVRSKLMGKETLPLQRQAKRVEDYMNYTLTEQMSEYRAETEKLIFNMALAGSSFRKNYLDPVLGRPAAMFVPAEDFVVEYGTADLRTCGRYTHVMRKSQNEVKKLQHVGFYKKMNLPVGVPRYSEVEDEKDSLSGVRATYDKDNRHELLEMFVDYELPVDDPFAGDMGGLALPYVITIDRATGRVLSIRRNWLEDDPHKNRRQHFVHYYYVPGMGFYGYGLAHLIGSTAKSATSILRQLLDAGTLANVQGGFKSRGLRVMGGDDMPVAPGEWRDVEVTHGSIRDNILPLPIKEPSPTLHALLKDIADDGRRFASLADANISEMSNQAPVGSTLAILERSLKNMSAVQARFHDSQKQEFKLLHDLIGEDDTPYPYELEPEEDGQVPNKQQDFDGRVDVIPTADPNAATMGMRIVQNQAALDLANTAPHLYDLPELHRRFLYAMDMRDPEKLVPTDDELVPTDPVSENMNILTSKPVRVHSYQDHEAHISAHMMASQDPKIAEMVKEHPNAPGIMAALAAHVVEHLAHKYRQEIEEEMGTTLPPYGEPIPPEVEVRLSKLVAEAAAQLFNKDVAEAKALEIARSQEDPVIQQQNRELDVKEGELARKKMADAAKTEFLYENLIREMEHKKAELASEERQKGAELMVEMLKAWSDENERRADRASKDQTTGVDMARRFVEDLARNDDLKKQRFLQEKDMEYKKALEARKIERETPFTRGDSE